jgi:hypothetical protein
MVVPEHHIREALARYVSGEIFLKELQAWFIPRAWEILTEGGASTDLIAEIELLLAEYTSGQRTETDLRDAFKAHAARRQGGFVVVHEPGFVGQIVGNQPSPAVFRWSTIAAGAESGNTTVDLRSDATAPEVRVEQEQAA